MAISRAQLAKELEPGLNALFGMSYDSYENEYEDIFVSYSCYKFRYIINNLILLACRVKREM